MKVDLYRISSSPEAHRSSRSIPSNTSSVQLGDEVLVYASKAGRPESRPGAVRADTASEDYLGSVEEKNLHLVVQIGNRFEHDHPNIPVILSKGRYLIVNIGPKAAKELAEAAGQCYMIRPLGKNEVVFDVASPSAERSAPEAWIKALADQVSDAGITDALSHLVSFNTRYSTSADYISAAAWAAQELAGLGYTTRREEVSVGDGTSLNIIADKSGNGTSARDLVLVVAHLDSINISGGPFAMAPGADDNGSGSVGVLEIARALKGHIAKHDLRFILFGGEEEGLFGSTQYVDSLSTSERQRIRAVVNMDMIATINTSAPTVLLEGAPLSQPVIDGLAEAASTYTQLAVQTSLNPFNSDHVPFIDAGIPAVLTIEGTDSANHNVHTIEDNLSHIRIELMREILRMNVAFVAKTLGKETIVVPGVNIQPAKKCGETTPNVPDLGDMLRNLPFQFSGCYKHNGGASARAGRGFVDPVSGQSTVALRNPIYRLDEPVYVESPEEFGSARRSDEQLRFTLNIDIDGTDPLKVVSGTVASGPATPGVASPHFIGRVVSDTPSLSGRNLTVNEFRFRWPETNNNIDLLTIELSGSALVPARATVIYRDSSQGRDFGPFILAQDSMYFREVEIDVDREENAIEVEPLNTLIHSDKPTDLPSEDMTLESAFGKAGIRITRSGGSGTIVDTGEAGDNKRWNYSELHDSMQLHWDAFANKPQWKMWLFLAELADDDGLGGVMFDGEIDEPGGVDRQGTAIFTKCPHFHTAAGGYIKANPPTEEAIKRELFFNLMHETGHAFNLAHSFQKELAMGWKPPSWMPMATDNQALSWMNYPDSATPGGGAGSNATWFYKRFRFRFDRGELLFLRHAPETYVQMGAVGWFQNHGRVARIDLDFRLKLIVRSLKQVYEFGEPVMVELRLSNESDQPITVHRNLDPSDGLVEMAVTNPKGERRPFLPVDHTRTMMSPHVLQPKGEPLYYSVDMTMGSFGFPFKEPGAYRIEASYTNVDGGSAAAVMQVYVRPPANYGVVPIVNELFNARLGLTMYVEGTRILGDVNERLDWVRKGLNEELGERNPVSAHLTTVRYKPLATPCKVIEPSLESSQNVRVLNEEPDVFVENVAPVLIAESKTAADTMGNIWYGEVVNTFTEAALDAGEQTKATQAQEQMLGIFKERNVIQSVIDNAENRLTEIKSDSSSARTSSRRQ